jgi:outer membrane protein assembly factor BamB
MNRSATVFIAAFFLLSLTASPALAESADDYWPMWRGSSFTGAAVKGNPPVTWSETENVKWKVKLPGTGTSSPVIWGDKIFFLTAVLAAEDAAGAASEASSASPSRPRPQIGGRGGPAPQGGEGRGPGGPGGERRGPGGPGGARGGGRPGGGMPGGKMPTSPVKFNVVCMDRGTGKIIWEKTVRDEMPHEAHHPSHGFASYSPITDGKHVWASFGSRGLHCFDLDGNHKWSRDLIKLSTRNAFGEGSTVAIAGDTVIALADHEGESKILAFDKLTGEPLWDGDRDELTSWATPIPVEVDGRVQVITSATNLIRAYDAKTGEIIWTCAGQTANVIPTPVLGFGNVYCTSGYRGSALQAIKLGGKGDLTGTDAVLWEVNEGTPYVPSPLLHGGNIYLSSGNKAQISCYDAKTGKPYFVKQQLEGLNDLYASPVGVADRVYWVGRDGTAQVIKASDTYEVIATNKLDDPIDASPAIVGDELYLKGKTHLYCIAKQ